MSWWDPADDEKEKSPLEPDPGLEKDTGTEWFEKPTEKETHPDIVPQVTETEQARNENTVEWFEREKSNFISTAEDLLTNPRAKEIPGVRAAAAQTLGDIPKGGQMQEDFDDLSPEARATIARPSTTGQSFWDLVQWGSIVSPVAAFSANLERAIAAIQEDPNSALGKYGFAGKAVAVASIGLSGLGPAGQLPESVAKMMQGEIETARAMPVQRVGQVVSTFSRPGAAIVRAIAENEVARQAALQGKPMPVDHVTGRPYKVRNASEIFQDVVSSLNPTPDTAYADVSYVDAFRRISQAAGGEGDEWYVWVPGIASDILLDPTTYLTFGGSSVTKAASQIRGIAYRALSAAGDPTAVARSTMLGQTIARHLATKSKQEMLTWTSDLMKGLAPGEIGEKAAQQVLDLGNRWGAEGLRLTVPFGTKGRSPFGLLDRGPESKTPGRGEIIPGEYFTWFRDDMRNWLKDSVRQYREILDEKALTHPNLPRYFGSDRIRSWEAKVDRIFDAFTTVSSEPILGGQSRSVLEAARLGTLSMDELNYAQNVMSKEFRRTMKGAKFTVKESEHAAEVVQKPWDLADDAFQEGALWRYPEAWKVIDEGKQETLRRATQRAYAAAIYNGGTEAGAVKHWTDNAESTILAGLSKEDADLLRPFLDPLLQRGANRVGSHWTEYNSIRSRLEKGMLRLVTQVEDIHKLWIKGEVAAGVPVEEIDAYVTHQVRNSDPMALVFGMRIGPGNKRGGQLGADFTEHRKLLSWQEMERLGLQPERNIFKLMAMRGYAHTVVMQRYTMGDKLIKRLHELKQIQEVKIQVLDEAGKPKTVLAKNIEEARVRSMVPGGRAPGVVEWRGKFYQVDRDIERVFQQFDRAHDLTERTGFFAAITPVLNWWKTRATIGRIGFHTRNFWSNLWNMWLGGWTGQNGWDAILSGLVGYVRREQSMTGANMTQMIREMREGRQIAGNKVGDAIDGMVDKARAKLLEWGKKYENLKPNKDCPFTYGELYDLGGRLGVMSKGWLGADVERTMYQQINDVAPGSVAHTFMKQNPFGREFILLKAMERGGKGIEDHARMTLFINRIVKHGDSPEEAARIVKIHMFDYKDISSVTRFLKDTGAAPFITWTAKNLPLQMKAIFTQPAKMALPFKVQRWMKKWDQTHQDESKRIAEEMLPEYVRRAHSLPWHPGSVSGRLPDMIKDIFGENETGNIMVWSPDLPYRELNTLAVDPDGSGFSFMTPLPRYFLEQLHSFYKTPVELYLNKRLMMDKRFQAVEAPPALRHIVPTYKNPNAKPGDDDENVPYMDERYLYAFQQILPDIASWERLLTPAVEFAADKTGAGDILGLSPKLSTPEERQKRAIRLLSEGTGIGRFQAFEKPEVEGAYFKKQTEKMTGRLPRKKPE